MNIGTQENCVATEFHRISQNLSVFFLCPSVARCLYLPVLQENYFSYLFQSYKIKKTLSSAFYASDAVLILSSRGFSSASSKIVGTSPLLCHFTRRIIPLSISIAVIPFL